MARAAITRPSSMMSSRTGRRLARPSRCWRTSSSTACRPAACIARLSRTSPRGCRRHWAPCAGRAGVTTSTMRS